MLNTSRIIAFVPVSDVDRAMHFYVDVLGLTVTDYTDEYCVLDAAGTCLRLTRVVELPAAEHTIVGWSVANIDVTTAELAARGLGFHRYDGIVQDQHGIWLSPKGDQVAWFSDPDGNTLSVTQFAESPATSMA
ncbi:MAG TPA: glyoxalase [Actinobacteria bacterium]|nr:glyoxalase [Actinomycetota bacterium]